MGDEVDTTKQFLSHDDLATVCMGSIQDELVDKHNEDI